MHFSFKARLAPARTAGFALASSLVIAMAAHASSGHGDKHGDGLGDAHGHDEPKAASAKVKPALGKIDLGPRGKPAEQEPAGKEHGGKEHGSKEHRGKEASAAKPEASTGEARTSVSMSELRDMIDQKIAEVRTKREAPPVLRLRPKAVAVAKKPAAQLHASLAPATTAKPALPTDHGRAALLPLPEDHGHVHGHGAPGSHLVNTMGRDVHWAYSGDTGPESWGRLKPEFQQCMRGKRQSPIDIRDGIAVQLDAIQFDYRPSGFRVIDNGHTVQVNVDQGNGITVQGRRYELVQFHFHRPSEERINGRQYEMVAHLVHKDADGRLAVIAVLMDAGKGHPVVQQVWNNLPLEKQIEQAAQIQMDLNQLLPEKRQYYTYMGSLTTPPCTEGVLWMVMKQPATVSRDQIGVFSKLYQMNARPIQSASGRLIKEGL